MSDQKLKFISLFSGIGGLDLGFECAGMECVTQVEIDEFCLRVLNKHWPNTPKFKDVRNVGKHNLPAADVIAGGFPCQPHSYAGKRRGKKDNRNLWPEYLRVIDELRPRFVVGENVPGIITTILDEILSDLEDRDYACQTFVIPAGAFNAPHWRDRVWIIAHSNGDGCSHRGNEIHATEAWQYAQCDAFASHTNVTNPNGTGLQKSICGQLGGISGKAGTSARGEFGGVFSESERWEESWFEVATRLCRVDDGLSRGMDRANRLKALGNAVVPQVAQFIGAQLLAALA